MAISLYVGPHPALPSLAMAVSALFLIVLGGLQWYEIHTGSADTHELAVTAKLQAENTVKLADAAQQQAAAAQSAVKIDKQALEEIHPGS